VRPQAAAPESKALPSRASVWREEDEMFARQAEWREFHVYTFTFIRTTRSHTRTQNSPLVKNAWLFCSP